MNKPEIVVAITKDEFRLIPHAQLRESPTNPRRHFHAQAMGELTESIRQQGVVQPIVVRRMVGAEVMPGLVTEKSGDIHFQIVTGARRFRASKAAGRDTVPAIVRQLSDDQVIEIQLIENLQREDLHPLDEAQGYQTLIDKTGMEIATIAAKVGKSESYVYQRLKLLALTDKAQKAFLAEKITAGHAILIARLQPADQAEALRECTQGYRTSVRDLIEWIDRHVHMDLHSAPFKKDDAQLIPEAGACVTCPKRTGFQPALFPDIAKKDTCTDPKCFQAKLQAFSAQRLAELKEQGEDVVKITTGYHDKPKGALTTDQYIKAGNTKCPDTKIGMLVDDHDLGKTMNVCTNPKCKIHFGRAARESESITRTGRNLAQERKHEAGKQAREQVIATLAADTAKLETGDLKLLAEAFIAELWHEEVKKLFKRRGWEPKKKGYSTDHRSVAHERIESMTPREVAGLLMECLMRSRLCPGDDELAKIAKKNGVDFYKLERKALEALTERDRTRREKEKQRAAATAQPKPKPSTCRFCGCTETTPCDVGVEGACAWIDKSHTACSNPNCLRRFNAEKKEKLLKGKKK
jgi:ParB family chromosome partitioning protein